VEVEMALVKMVSEKDVNVVVGCVTVVGYEVVIVVN
jgi:hypothetical protein